MIRCESVTFSYDPKGHRVLDGFSKTFRPGVTMLKGPSGCGKTTLLRLMAGYLTPDAGTVAVDGFSSPSDLDFALRGSAFAFQDMNLLPLATVRYNLEFVCSIAGIPSREASVRTDDLLRRLGLVELAGRVPQKLSGGQKQRAALARALVKRPRYLFLDEPTANLDKLNTAVIRAALAELPADTVCIISSHDERLEGICHEIVDFTPYLPLEGHLHALV